MTPKPSIGFCGLGAMGFGMATHLVRRGYAVTGFDVHAPTLARFEAAGGQTAASLRASAQDKDFYIVMVASQWQAQDALFGASDGIAGALPRSATLVLCSTVPSVYAQQVARQLAAMGRDDVFFLDAPVSGGAVRAAHGSLSIMAGACEAALQRGKWLLQELAAPAKLYLVEGGVGAGSNMKMVHQVLAAIQILAMSEAYGLGARLGLAGEEVFEAVVASPPGPGWSFMFENRSPRTLAGEYFPGASATTIILKDTSIITSTAQRYTFPASLCSIAEQVLFSAVDRGWGADDDAGLVRLWTQQPVSSIHSSLPAEEKQRKLKLVVNLLAGIHLVSAAEALSLAKRVGIPLPQFYELACDAAGSSTAFREAGKTMVDILEAREEDRQEGNGEFLAEWVDGLGEAVKEAQKIKCPLYLGTAALNQLWQAGNVGSTMSLGSLLECYGV